jgi:hypothetical protein
VPNSAVTSEVRLHKRRCLVERLEVLLACGKGKKPGISGVSHQRSGLGKEADRWMGMHHALAGRLQEEDLRALPEQSTR